jgi:hypothetical protein
MNHTSRRKAGQVSTWMLLSMAVLTFAVLASSGCITTAAILTVSALSQEGEGGEGGEYIATVRIPKSPEAVYNAALSVAMVRDDVNIDKQDARRHRIDVSRGLDKATVKISKVEDNESEVIVHARAGEPGVIPEDITKSVVDALCKELNVQANWSVE